SMVKQPPTVPLALDDMDRPPIAPPTPLKSLAAKPAIIAHKRSGGSGKSLLAVAGAVFVVLAGVAAWLWFGSGSGSMPEAQATVPVPVKTPAARPASGPKQTAAQPSAPGAMKGVPGGVPKPEPPPPPPPPPHPAQLTERG